MEQDIPQESLIVKLSQQMTSEFDKILIDSRGIKRTMLKLETAEKKQQILDEWMEKTLEVGNRLITKIELYKTRIQEQKQIESNRKAANNK